MDLSKTKIRVENPEHGRLIQEEAFKLGWNWCGCSGYQRFNAYAYYFDENKEMSYGSNEFHLKASYFQSCNAREITLEEIQGELNLRKTKIYVEKEDIKETLSILFDKGVIWTGTIPGTLDSVDICDAQCYYINSQLRLTKTDNKHGDYFDKHLNKEITLEQLRKHYSPTNINMELRDHLRNKFVYTDQVADIIDIGIKTKKNVFLYGRGGHAKSEIAQEVLKFIDPSEKDSFVQSCGEGLTEEKLFGGLNLKKFEKTGEIEYLVENSFMNKKFVVFEELLDSRMNVLLSLKDIITSGVFRQGSQQFKIKTEFILVLTNRTKQEVSEDNSIKALMERFPLEMKVEWDNYESDSYKTMFKKVLGDEMSVVADIASKINESGDFISPRTAIHMAQVYKASDITKLKYFGVTSDIIDKMEKEKKVRDMRNFLLTMRIAYDKALSKFSKCDTIPETKVCIATLSKIQDDLDVAYPDQVYNEYTSLRDEIGNSIIEIKSNLVNIIMNE